jgi:thiol-disulfide isomerase/thioredoxin
MLLVVLLFALVAWKGVSTEHQVIDVNHRNIEEVLGNQPLILEFYAPWCQHCKNFELPYQTVARTVSQEGYLTGRVDIDASPAVAARFGVQSIPMFFLVRDGKVWKIKNRRTIDNLVEFCLHEYTLEPSMGMWLSPLGPVGRFKGVLTHAGGKVIDNMTAWSTSMKVPILIPYVIVALVFALSILLCTFAGIYYSVTHVKMD